MNLNRICKAAALSLVAAAFTAAALPVSAEEAKPQAAAQKPADKEKWQSLFDGKTLGKWKETDFGGGAKPQIKDGAIILPVGADLTGITWSGEPPYRTNYELELEAKRVDGSDFFCGLTFPVGKNFASLILGGWGGGVCGISSLDGEDASSNETTTFKNFKNGQWYAVRLRVTDDKLQAWLDKEQIVDVATGDRRINTRIEVEASQPLGIATWQTSGAVRNIRIRPLEASEIVKEEK